MLKKKFGQNFLINETIANKIINCENILNKNILEIGPGNLALTKYILQKKPKQFISLEIDNDLKKLYDKDIIKFILFEDARRFNELEFFNNKKFSIISNLPFNISSTLLLKWNLLQNNYSCIDSMTLMFQKELAERIISKENTKQYGRLSIITQAFFKIEKKLEVLKESFKPQPKVDAIVLKFTSHKTNKISKKNFTKLEKVTQFFFNERRKKNEKKIKKIFSSSQISNYNFDKLFSQRAENINKEIYYKMSELI